MWQMRGGMRAQLISESSWVFCITHVPWMIHGWLPSCIPPENRKDPQIAEEADPWSEKPQNGVGPGIPLGFYMFLPMVDQWLRLNNGKHTNFVNFYRLFYPFDQLTNSLCKTYAAACRSRVTQKPATWRRQSNDRNKPRHCSPPCAIPPETNEWWSHGDTWWHDSSLKKYPVTLK